MTKTCISTLILAATLSLAVGAQAETGVTANKIVLGTSQSITGPLAFQGTNHVAGIEAYLDAVNAAGGVNGRKIEWKCYDDAYKPQDAVANVKRLVEQDKVFAILNLHGSATSKAPVPYLEEKKVPMLFPLQGDPGMVGRKYVFTAYSIYDEQAAAVVQWLVQKKAMKRIGIFYQDDALGLPFVDTLKRELKSMGLDLAGAETIKRGTVDATVQVAKLSGANLDACFVTVVPGQGAQFFKEAEKMGWKVKPVGISQMTDETLLALAGGAAEGYWGSTQWPDPVYSQLPAMKKFRETLAKYKPKATPNRHNLYGYFYAMLTVEGIKRAGKDLTREGLIKALEGIENWESGIVPPVSFSATDHVAVESNMMVEAKAGRFVPISGWLSIKNGKLIEIPIKE